MNRFNSSAATPLPERDDSYLAVDGDFLLEIMGCSFAPGQDGRKSYIVHFRVHESDQRGTTPVNKAGTEATWVNKVATFKGAAEAWDRDNLRFIAAVSGYDPRTETALIEEHVQPEVDRWLEESIDTGKLNGLLVRCSTYNKGTSKFTVHGYRPVSKHEPTRAKA